MVSGEVDGQPIARETPVFELHRRHITLHCNDEGCNGAVQIHDVLDVRSVKHGAARHHHQIRLCRGCGAQTVGERQHLTTFKHWGAE